MKSNSNHKKGGLVSYVSDTYLSAANTIRGGDSRTVVYVEGYDDISFWRKVFDRVEAKRYDAESGLKSRKFKVMTPVRTDLAKGKKVVLTFSDRSGENLLLCVDSDFDYLLGSSTEQSNRVNSCKYLIQTYAYAIENLQCDPRTLRSVATRVTNNDDIVFDFEEFFNSYSQIVYPLFVWYYWSAASNRVDVFPLSEFRETVRVNFLDLSENGTKTLDWVQRKVDKSLQRLQRANSAFIDRVAKCSDSIQELGVTPYNVNFYMQGHTLLDDVVSPMMEKVCDKLRYGMQVGIENSYAKAISKRNQMSGYINSISDISLVLRENTGYMEYEFFAKIVNRIEEIYKQQR